MCTAGEPPRPHPCAALYHRRPPQQLANPRRLKRASGDMFMLLPRSGAAGGVHQRRVLVRRMTKQGAGPRSYSSRHPACTTPGRSSRLKAAPGTLRCVILPKQMASAECRADFAAALAITHALAAMNATVAGCMSWGQTPGHSHNMHARAPNALDSVQTSEERRFNHRATTPRTQARLSMSGHHASRPATSHAESSAAHLHGCKSQLWLNSRPPTASPARGVRSADRLEESPRGAAGIASTDNTRPAPIGAPLSLQPELPQSMWLPDRTILPDMVLERCFPRALQAPEASSASSSSDGTESSEDDSASDGSQGHSLGTSRAGSASGKRRGGRRVRAGDLHHARDLHVQVRQALALSAPTGSRGSGAKVQTACRSAGASSTCWSDCC